MKLVDMIIKDIKVIVYDVKSLAILLVMPIILMSILGASLQGVFGDESESGEVLATIGVVKDYDREAEMYKLEGKINLDDVDQETLEGLDPEKSFFDLLDNEELQSFIAYNIVAKEEGYDLLKDGEIDALIILPKDYIFNRYMILAGSRLVSDIDYVVNPDNDFLAGIVKSIVDAYVDMNNNVYAIQMTAIAEVANKVPGDALISIDDLFDPMMMDLGGIDVAVKSVHRNESINSFQYYAAAIMCMFLLYSAGVGGRTLLAERKEKTIPRLTVSGNGLMLIVVSNYIRVVLMVILQSAIMIAYTTLVLKVDWGDFTTILVTMILSGLAVGAIGMLVAIITLISDNYKVANAFEFGIIYVMALIGGSFVPVEALPKAISELGFLSLNGQALGMYINGMYRLPLSESMNEITILIGFTVVFISASMLLIRAKGRDLVC